MALPVLGPRALEFPFGNMHIKSRVALVPSSVFVFCNAALAGRVA